MTQEQVDNAKERHRITELKLSRSPSYAETLSIAESSAASAHYDRQVLIEWIELIEASRKQLINRYEKKVKELEEQLYSVRGYV